MSQRLAFPYLKISLYRKRLFDSVVTTRQSTDNRGVGSILPYVDVRIVPDGDVNEPEIGEIFVRTPFCFLIPPK